MTSEACCHCCWLFISLRKLSFQISCIIPWSFNSSPHKMWHLDSHNSKSGSPHEFKVILTILRCATELLWPSWHDNVDYEVKQLHVTEGAGLGAVIGRSTDSSRSSSSNIERLSSMRCRWVLARGNESSDGESRVFSHSSMAEATPFTNCRQSFMCVASRSSGDSVV